MLKGMLKGMQTKSLHQAGCTLGMAENMSRFAALEFGPKAVK